MRNRSRTIAGAVLMAVGLAACSSGGGDEGGPVTLRYGIWDENQRPALEEIVSAFEQENPDIDVKIEVTSPTDQYWTKLQTSATGGSAPDVFWMNGPNFQLYASEGVIKPLADLAGEGDVDTSAYPEALVDLYTYDDELYALPKDFDTIGLWYNKELFDEAGVDYPDETWTWDDVEGAAAKLTDPESRTWGIAAPAWSQENYFNTIFQAGGEVISEDGTALGFDDPATQEGLQFWVDLIEQGSSPGVQQMTDTAPGDLFKSGKVAMIYAGSWEPVGFVEDKGFAEKIDVAVLPEGPGGRATVIHGLGNTVFEGTEHPEEAWELVKYLGSQEAAEVFAATGTVIPAYNGTQQAWVDAYPQFNVQAYIDQLDDARPYPVSVNTSAWAEVMDEHLVKAWSGETSVADAAAAIDAEGEVKLAEEKE